MDGLDSRGISKGDNLTQIDNKTSNNVENRLKCISINARSVVNKLRELELLLDNEKPHILGITETWLNSSIADNELCFQGYTLLRKDREAGEKTRGGGVLFYIRTELNPVIVTEFNCNKVETLFCNIQCNRDSTLLGVCYRPPDSSKNNDDEFYSLLNRLDYKHLVLMGDFNYSELSWHSDNTIDRSHPFVECLDNNFLSQLVDKPTRGNNFLDLIISSDANTIEDISIEEPFETSDHQTITFSILASQCHTIKKVPVYNYFKGDYDIIRREIPGLKWDELSQCRDVDIIWNRLKSDILNLRDKYITKKGKNKSKCKWVTRKVQRLRLSKKKAWIKYQKSNKNTELYEDYKCKLRESVSENKRAKEVFEQKLADNIKNDNKSFYSYVNSKSRSNNKIGPLKDLTNNIINGNKETADFLNNYFSSVFTQENVNFIPECEKIFSGSSNEIFSDLIIDENEILSRLNKINVGKSIGPDDIHGKLLYEIRQEISKPLAHLFTLSIAVGTVPQDWRDANVIPLFKKGSKSQAQNYRPVSLLSIVGKLLESILKEKLVEHMNRHNLIKDSQHGFTSGRSCLTNLLEFFDKVTCELDKSNPVDLIYLDFCKAFDKVPHCRLLRKLEAHGVGGNILGWIKEWLANRRQRVVVEGEFSDWTNVSSGVPQGSVLGPILFLVYINDLELGLISLLNKFADDSKLLKTVSSEEDVNVLREDLVKLESWADKWQMEFNVEKCSVIHLGSNNACADYKLYNRQLKVSENEKDLGIIVDNKLKFSEHCDSIVSKANATLGMIKRNIVSRNHKVITKLYKTLVRPKLEYCVQAWRPYFKKDIDKIEKVQRRATKLITECRNLSYKDRLSYTGLTTLEDRRTRGDMIEVFKLSKGFTKVDKNKFLSYTGSSKTRGHYLKLEKYRPRLDLRKNFFSHRIVNSWNALPSYVVEADSVNTFKNRYDKLSNRAC